MALDVSELKKMAAEEAVELYVKDGMTVGLGTGSTARYAIDAIGRLVSEDGYHLKCVATSEQSAEQARGLGLEVLELADVKGIDVTIDGADEVDPSMNLIKGLGGALLREKIVAAATLTEVIIVDDSKLVDVLGSKVSLPVEVVRFGHEHTAYALKRQGCTPVLRMKDGAPFVTDTGNYIYDCAFGPIERPYFLETAIDSIPGVVENGLFLNRVEEVLVAGSEGSVYRFSERRHRSRPDYWTSSRAPFGPDVHNVSSFYRTSV